MEISCVLSLTTIVALRDLSRAQHEGGVCPDRCQDIPCVRQAFLPSIPRCRHDLAAEEAGRTRGSPHQPATSKRRFNDRRNTGDSIS